MKQKRILDIFILIFFIILQNFVLSSIVVKDEDSSEEKQQEMENKKRVLCPLNENVICNEEDEREFHCVCTMFGSSDPAPEQTCSRLLNFTNKRDNYFEAISVKLRLKQLFFPQNESKEKGSNWADNYLEEKFKTQISGNFKIPKRNIIFLRLRCLEDENEGKLKTSKNDEKVIVQFVVLRKNKKRNILPPLSQNDLIAASTVVSRLKGMNEIQRLGGFEIIHVEKVDELLPVELNFDNSRLIIQAIAVGIFIILTCLCGIWVTFRRRSPEEDGYSDVEEQKTIK
uniref:Uncharacterized protein n=1 Tax=Meloidogyne incognita TaxID=6306 RepID=A0A914KVA0_MELIC